MMLAAAGRRRARTTVAFLNAQRINFDGRLDLSRLRGVAVDVRGLDASPTAKGTEEDSSLTNHHHDDDVPALVRRVCPPPPKTKGSSSSSEEDSIVLVTKELPIDAAAIAAFPKAVKCVCEAGTGVNNVDRQALAARGVELRRCPAYSTEAMATLVVTQILNLSSSMIDQQRRLWAGDRDHFFDVDANIGAAPHFELNGKTLGLIGGNGAIGHRVSSLAQAFHMRVLVASRSGENAPPGSVATSLDDLLSKSDFVSVHCPLTDETRGLLDATKLALFKPTAYLINTARGAIVDETALVDALTSRRLAGAALDVQHPEPPPPDSPLWALDNLILTPHIGWRKLETRQRLLDMVVDNIQAFLAGDPRNLVTTD